VEPDHRAADVIVTISRQAAGRGEQVAQQVAQRLNLPLVDAEAVHRAAVRIDLARENLADPQRADRVGGRLAQMAVLLAAEPPQALVLVAGSHYAIAPARAALPLGVRPS